MLRLNYPLFYTSIDKCRLPWPSVTGNTHKTGTGSQCWRWTGHGYMIEEGLPAPKPHWLHIAFAYVENLECGGIFVLVRLHLLHCKNNVKRIFWISRPFLVFLLTNWPIMAAATAVFSVFQGGNTWPFVICFAYFRFPVWDKKIGAIFWTPCMGHMPPKKGIEQDKTIS